MISQTFTAPKIEAHLSRIKWHEETALNVYNKWRAVSHLFKLETCFCGDKLKLDSMLPPIADAGQVDAADATVGRILLDRKRNLILVRCLGGHWAAFSRITVARKPVMSAIDFANGYLHKKAIGQHFFTWHAAL